MPRFIAKHWLEIILWNVIAGELYLIGCVIWSNGQ